MVGYGCSKSFTEKVSTNKCSRNPFKRFQNITFLLREERENEGKTSERWEKWFDVLRNTDTEIAEDRE